MNLGAMLHVNGKLAEAEQSYLAALRIKPDDQVTTGRPTGQTASTVALSRSGSRSHVTSQSGYRVMIEADWRAMVLGAMNPHNSVPCSSCCSKLLSSFFVSR